MCLAFAVNAIGQEGGQPQAVADPPKAASNWLSSPYRSRVVNDVDTTNTPRLYGLMRAGNIYLSLNDAIAIAIENNLDVQMQRYQMEIGRTDVLRAEGGGTL